MSIDEVMAVAFRLATTNVLFTNPSGELDRDGESAVQERATQLRAAIEQHVAEAVARERQAIEKICEEFGAWNKTASEILDAIYDRSGKEPKP